MEDVIAAARNYERSGLNWEDVLVHLRADGYSIIDSIKATREVKNVDLREAKAIVHFSRAWSDLRDDYDDFHRQIIEQVTENSEDLQRDFDKPA